MLVCLEEPIILKIHLDIYYTDTINTNIQECSKINTQNENEMIITIFDSDKL